MVTRTRGGKKRARIEAETQPVVEPPNPNAPSPPPVVIETRMETSPPPGGVEATSEKSPPPGVVEHEIRSGEGDSKEEEGKEGDSVEEEEEEEEEGERDSEEGERDSDEGEKDSDEGEKNSEEGEENSENSDEGEEDNVDDSIDSVETSVIRPMRMYFPPSEYNKKIKISTRCYISEVLETLDSLKPPLNDMERNWFEKHRQFKHIFHMPRDGNHKVMGMWLLLLRTVETENQKEGAWFCVNGSPTRYGIREHALISGLDCRNYQLGFKDKGSMKFVRKYFETGATIRYMDVKAKLEEMEPSMDRLKMAVLYFLSRVIVGHTKVGKDAPSIDPFLLRAVDNLDLCKWFPWGRYSFDQIMKEISHTMNHFGGVVKEGVVWPLPGFCIPLEILAFEAIPELFQKFREPCLGADDTCPRMCKSKFKKSEMKGFPLSRINEALGTTKDISNILIASVDEEKFLHRMTEREDDEGKHDPIVNSWLNHHRKGYQVFFEDMYNEDVAARVLEEENVAERRTEAPALATADTRTEAPALAIESPEWNELVGTLNTFKSAVEEQMKGINDKFEGLGGRIQGINDKFHVLEGQMQVMKDEFHVLEGRMKVIEGRMDEADAEKKKRGVKRTRTGKNV